MDGFLCPCYSYRQSGMDISIRCTSLVTKFGLLICNFCVTTAYRRRRPKGCCYPRPLRMVGSGAGLRYRRRTRGWLGLAPFAETAQAGGKFPSASMDGSCASDGNGLTCRKLAAGGEAHGSLGGVLPPWPARPHWFRSLRSFRSLGGGKSGRWGPFGRRLFPVDGGSLQLLRVANRVQNQFDARRNAELFEDMK